MSDLSGFLAALNHELNQGAEAVVATVVKVEGSAYRKPGARMVIPVVGAATGTISGGCLEQDLAKKAWWLTERGPVVRRYSTAADDDDADDEEASLTFGLGCNGTVHVLLERVSLQHRNLYVRTLNEVNASGSPAAIASVIGSPAESGLQVGDRCVVFGAGGISSDQQSTALSRVTCEALQSVLAQKKSALVRYGDDMSGVEVFLEYLQPARRLVIFGAGHDAMPLVHFAKGLGWHVTVIDGRSHFARAERFPSADAVICHPPDAEFGFNEVVNGAAVIVMSHSYRQDRQWLKNVLLAQPIYVGQLGPRDRTDRLLAEMNLSKFNPAWPSLLHYPVGLDLGGDTPASVALAVMAEITAVVNQRGGGKLKDRKKKIHDTEIAVVHPMPELGGHVQSSR